MAWTKADYTTLHQALTTSTTSAPPSTSTTISYWSIPSPSQLSVMSGNIQAKFSVGEVVHYSDPTSTSTKVVRIERVDFTPSRGVFYVVRDHPVGNRLMALETELSALPQPRTKTRSRKKPVTKKQQVQTKPVISLDSVILAEAKKHQIKVAISQLEHQQLIFEQWGFGQVFEKGTAVSLLFWGIPGTGKTLMAQAIASELGAELKTYSTAEIESMEPGGAERMIQAIFVEARKLFESGKKRVLLFDECDSLLTDRNEVGAILGAQINALLSAIEHHQGVIIFTTNRLGKLDPALERRISAKIEFEFPDVSAREKIWQRLIPAQAPLDKTVSFKQLARHPLPGGNIKNAVLTAVRLAAYHQVKSLTMDHFEQAAAQELAALEDFISSYEAAPHTSGGGLSMTKESGLTVNKKPMSQLSNGFLSNKLSKNIYTE